MICSVGHPEYVVLALVFLLHATYQRQMELLSRKLLVISNHALGKMKIVSFATVPLYGDQTPGFLDDLIFVLAAVVDIIHVELALILAVSTTSSTGIVLLLLYVYILNMNSDLRIGIVLRWRLLKGLWLKHAPNRSSFDAVHDL